MKRPEPRYLAERIPCSRCETVRAWHDDDLCDTCLAIKEDRHRLYHPDGSERDPGWARRHEARRNGGQGVLFA